jgi:hypothetical protein
MSEWSPIRRPVTIAEMSVAFDTPRPALDRVLKRYGIKPLCRAGHIRLYGPSEVRQVYQALGGHPDNSI